MIGSAGHDVWNGRWWMCQQNEWMSSRFLFELTQLWLFFIDSYKYTHGHQGFSGAASLVPSLASRLWILSQKGRLLGARVPGDGAFGFKNKMVFVPIYVLPESGSTFQGKSSFTRQMKSLSSINRKDIFLVLIRVDYIVLSTIHCCQLPITSCNLAVMWPSCHHVNPWYVYKFEFVT